MLSGAGLPGPAGTRGRGEQQSDRQDQPVTWQPGGSTREAGSALQGEESEEGQSGKCLGPANHSSVMGLCFPAW